MLRIMMAFTLVATTSIVAEAKSEKRLGYRYQVPVKFVDDGPQVETNIIKQGDPVVALKYAPFKGAKFESSSKQTPLKKSGKPAKLSVDVDYGQELYMVSPINLEVIAFCSNNNSGLYHGFDVPHCFIDENKDGNFDGVSTSTAIYSENGINYGGRLKKIYELDEEIPYSTSDHSGDVFGHIVISFEDKKTLKSNFNSTHSFWRSDGVLHRSKLPTDKDVTTDVQIGDVVLSIKRVEKRAIEAKIKKSPSVEEIRYFFFDNFTAPRADFRPDPDPSIYELAVE